MPNNRLVRSASVLRDQVLAKFPETTWNGAAEPDGLNVIRAIQFTGEDATNYLSRVLPMLHPEEERIVAMHRQDGSTILVEFANGVVADHTHPFSLDAGEVLAFESGRTEEEAFRSETQEPVVEVKAPSRRSGKQKAAEEAADEAEPTA